MNEFLSDSEKRVIGGMKKSKGDIAAERAVCRKALQEALSDEVIVDSKKLTIMQLLAINTVKEAINNPSTSKLKDIATILGENKQTIDLNLQGADDLFGDIVNK